MTKPWKTIEDFKRALIPGARFHTYNHLFEEDRGIREVIKKQRFLVSFKNIDGDQSYESFLRFPTKGDADVEANSITIWGDFCGEYKKLMTITKVDK